MVLFVNDNYFSYLLARPLIENYNKDIKLIVFSLYRSSSINKIKKIYERTYLRYFLFRTFVQIATYILYCFGKNTRYLVKKYNIPYIFSYNLKNEIYIKEAINGSDIGVAINFDQIINEDILNCFKYGILNVHASKLPKDRGISPAIWAFARGDKTIWVSIYKMDKGIDTGPIYTQFNVQLYNSESFFSVYKRICENSGIILQSIISKIGDLVPNDQLENVPSNYLGIPDKNHKYLMKKNRKKFIKVADLISLIKEIVE